MSYYILPKNINNIYLNPRYSNEISNKPYVSQSLFNYYNLVKNQIVEMFTNESNLSGNSFEDACKIIHPYEFIFSKVPGSKFSVSKLKSKNNIFYDLLEISNNVNIFDSNKTNHLKFLHVSSNHEDSIKCFELFRYNHKDSHLYMKEKDLDLDLNIDFDNKIKFDFLFYETTYSEHFISLTKSVIIILKNMKSNGNVIIKISDIFYKLTIDVLYFLSSLFEKVYICKPNSNNIASFDRYIVCKNFLFDEKYNKYLNYNYFNLLIFIKKLENKNIASILDFDIPYFFKNKVDDINIIIGQRQLEALDQIITIYKNKNDKIETIKKNAIQKSIIWCEKYKIPYNKFTYKINIFLPILQENT